MYLSLSIYIYIYTCIERDKERDISNYDLPTPRLEVIERGSAVHCVSAYEAPRLCGVCIYIYIYIYIHIYIYIYREREISLSIYIYMYIHICVCL